VRCERREGRDTAAVVPPARKRHHDQTRTAVVRRPQRRLRGQLRAVAPAAGVGLRAAIEHCVQHLRIWRRGGTGAAYPGGWRAVGGGYTPGVPNTCPSEEKVLLARHTLASGVARRSLSRITCIRCKHGVTRDDERWRLASVPAARASGSHDSHLMRGIQDSHQESPTRRRTSSGLLSTRPWRGKTINWRCPITASGVKKQSEKCP
jgi:hypothetical protein